LIAPSGGQPAPVQGAWLTQKFGEMDEILKGGLPVYEK
jgi:hypothetical protein